MASIPFGLESIVVAFLYLGSGYAALWMSHLMAGKKKVFYEMNGTDKTIQTFLIGSFALLVSLYANPFTSQNSVTINNAPKFFVPIVIVTGVSTVVIWRFLTHGEQPPPNPL